MRKLASALAAVVLSGCAADDPRIETPRSPENTLEVKVFFEEKVPAKDEGRYCEIVKKGSELLLGAVKDKLPEMHFTYACGGRWRSWNPIATDIKGVVSLATEMRSLAVDPGDLNFGFSAQFLDLYGGLVENVGERFALISTKPTSKDTFTIVVAHELGHMLGLYHCYRRSLMFLDPKLYKKSSKELVASLDKEERGMLVEHLKALLAYNQIFKHKLYFPLADKEKVMESVEISRRMSPRIYFHIGHLAEDEFELVQVHLKATGSYNIVLNHDHPGVREDELKLFFEKLEISKEKVLFYSTEPEDAVSDMMYNSTLMIPEEVFLRYSREILEANVSAGFLSADDGKYLEKVVEYSKKWNVNPYLVVYQERLRWFVK